MTKRKLIHSIQCLFLQIKLETYQTSLDTFDKLLHDNITKTYKHRSEDNIWKSTMNLNRLHTNFQLATELNARKKCEALIFLKNHNKNLNAN